MQIRRVVAEPWPCTGRQMTQMSRSSPCMQAAVVIQARGKSNRRHAGASTSAAP
jgi:hypothetical protein